jgi:hypothetical protein
MGLSRNTEQAKPQAHLFLSIYLHNLRSKIPSSLCRNADVLLHVVVFVLQDARPVNGLVIHFPENSSNMELSNVPR